MLKFSKDHQFSNNWRTLWRASGNCDTDYEITRVDGKYYVTVCQYKRFVTDTGSFAYFKDAKKWANKDNDYLDCLMP